jgi:hypothetical protein
LQVRQIKTVVVRLIVAVRPTAVFQTTRRSGKEKPADAGLFGR